MLKEATPSRIPHLVDHPGTVEMPVLRWLPPAKPSGARTGLQGNFQGNVSSHIAGVTEEELLEKAPCEAPVEWILQQHRLAPGVRYPLATSQSHEELHKSNRGSTYWKDLFSTTSYTMNQRDLEFVYWLALWFLAVRVSFRRSYDFLSKASRI